MEEYKDVILSQAPAMYGKTGQAPGIAMESYKGILLCARPSNLPLGPSFQLRGDAPNDGTGGLSTKSGGVAPAFIPGGATETPVGLGPSAEERATMERNHRKRLENYRNRRANASTVLSRHKRWLRSFAAEVRKMKEGEIEREVELARRAEQFRQQWAQKHAEAEGRQSVKEQPHQQEAAVNVERDGDGAKKQAAVTTTAKKKKKPKWALTEDEALEDELAGADELLEFAKNLDYEKYISDYEVAGALAIMRERVEEIARENNWSKEAVKQAADDEDEGEDEEGEEEGAGDDHVAANIAGRPRGEHRTPGQAICTAAAKRAAPCKLAIHKRGWDKSTSISGVLKRAIFRDTLVLAERILASSVSMQKIHTKYSLARVLQRCVLNGDSVAEAMQKPSIGGSKGLDEVPRVVKVHPDATGLEKKEDSVDGGTQRVLLALQRSKERTQGLPYLYRCPAL